MQTNRATTFQVPIPIYENLFNPETLINIFPDRPRTYIRCKELVSFCNVQIGHFDHTGLRIRILHESYRNASIGIPGLWRL